MFLIVSRIEQTKCGLNAHLLGTLSICLRGTINAVSDCNAFLLRYFCVEQQIKRKKIINKTLFINNQAGRQLATKIQGGNALGMSPDF